MRDADARRFLADLAEEERFATWHLVRPDGSLAGGGVGCVDLLVSIRLTRPAARLLAHLPDLFLEALYRLIARNRSRLGRLVPDGPAPRRYP